MVRRQVKKVALSPPTSRTRRTQINERPYISKFSSRCTYLVCCAHGAYTFEGVIRTVAFTVVTLAQAPELFVSCGVPLTTIVA